ncbi:unnamed protein product [Vitrella brassicaformis CCMP3155]|uniref:peptidylprolyl isomerase n=2 Tax=Vitrella brassicaformis TaxID=1169539 RepID=A0A0G4EJ74_VITBC|nr:unnamed protein product [Vitrella brassicaformis CCMP3155]|eukprot:CEL97061.1 unnamed protein product [Vitrella brassicaformis CCMP3155]
MGVRRSSVAICAAALLGLSEVAWTFRVQHSFSDATRLTRTPSLRRPSLPEQQSTGPAASENAECTSRRGYAEEAARAAVGIAALSPLLPSFPSNAAKSWQGGLNAPSAAGSRVNKDADSLLRYGLPIQDKDVTALQVELEAVKGDIPVKRFDSAVNHLNKARVLIRDKEASLLKAIRPKSEDKAKELLASIGASVDPLIEAIREPASRGSPQEAAKLDKCLELQGGIADKMTALMALMVPENYKVPVPQEFASLPQLQGRAKVEMVVKKADGSKFDLEGRLYDEAKLVMVVDGWNAPVTAGNFVDLVSKGFYDSMKISRSDGFVVQTGKPDSGPEGYVPTGAKEPRRVPLEIFVKGDNAPMYGETTEEDGRGFAATTLPFQAYGALGMARSEFDNNSGSSQFFWLLFDSDLTPAGKNFMDGRYACFGYTVSGADFLRDIRVGDTIVSARVVEGIDKLQKTGKSESPSYAV